MMIWCILSHVVSICPKNTNLGTNQLIVLNPFFEDNEKKCLNPGNNSGAFLIKQYKSKYKYTDKSITA